MKSHIAATGLALLGAFLAVFVGGCSMILDDNSVVYSVAPGKYDYLDCKGITERSDANAQRAAELAALMQRANQDPMGPFVSNMVYRDEYNVRQADQLALRQIADQKRCVPELKPRPLAPMH